MALAKSDLQAIKKVVKTETDPLKKGQVSLQKSVATLEKGQAGLQISVAKLEKGQAKLEKGQKKLKKDLNIVVKGFDTEYLGLKKRVQKIETHLEFAPPEF